MSSGENGEISTEITLLTGRHFLFPKTKLKYEISVTNLQISWTLDSPNGSTQSLQWPDVLGCDCMKGKNQQDTNAYITVYAYPHKKKFASKKTARQRQTLIFSFDARQSFDENRRDAEPWKTLIMCLAQNVAVESPDTVSSLVPPAAKKLLVLVNPFSGPGKALTIFQQRVVPILAEANVHFNMIITQHAGHAYKLARKLELEQWYGIVIVSGDGLIYEVVNGLMQHHDWERAIKMPLGCLPGGSGNALAAALLYAAREPYLDNCVLHSSIQLAKHDLLPMDLVAVDTQDGKRLYSFLSVCWGIIADVDIESEKYRRLGPVRFTIGALVRIVNLRKYHGRVSFLPVAPYHPPQPLRRQSQNTLSETAPSTEPQLLRRTQSEMADISVPTRRVSSQAAGVSGIVEEEQREGDALERVNGGENGENEDNKVNFDLDTEENGAQGNGDQQNNPRETNGKNITENSADGQGDHDNTTQNGNARSGEAIPPNDSNDQSQSSTSPVPTPLLPALSDPVPDGWTTVEDEFTMVAAVYQTHLSIDMIATPPCKLDDGLIYLTMIRHAGMTRSRLLRIMTAMETGSHIGMDGIDMVPCKAFRIEPMNAEGIMTCDGEEIAYGRVQGQVLPSMANVMARKPRDTVN